MNRVSKDPISWAEIAAQEETQRLSHAVKKPTEMTSHTQTKEVEEEEPPRAPDTIWDGRLSPKGGGGENGDR